MHDIRLPNCHPKNVVQVGIGGWSGNQAGYSEYQKQHGASMLAMQDIKKRGGEGRRDRPRYGVEGCEAVSVLRHRLDLDPRLRAGDGIAEAWPAPATPRLCR